MNTLIERFRDQWIFYLFILVILHVIIKMTPFLLMDSIWPDESLYAWQAQQICEDKENLILKEVIEYHPPLFPFVLSIISCNDLSSFRLLIFIMWILNIWLIFVLSKDIHSPTAGLIASAGLAYNSFYQIYAVRVLIDVLLIFLVLLLLLLFHKKKESDDFTFDYLIGGVVAFIILSKSYGVFILPFVASYYLFLGHPRKIDRLARVLIINVPLVVFLSLINFFVFGQFWQGLHGDFTRLRFHFEIFVEWLTLIPQTIIFWPFIIFAMFGTFYVFKFPRYYAIRVALVWSLLFVPVLISSSELDMRYLLPMLPIVLIVAAIAISEFINRLKIGKKVLILFGFIAILISVNERSFEKVILKSNGYIGFSEASHWLRENYSDNSVLFSNSKRTLRYLGTGIDRIEMIPHTEDEFVNVIRSTKEKNQILVLDIWEYSQPKWIYPLTEDNLMLLERMGFKLQKEVRRDMFGENKIVILIFVRMTR